MMCQNGVMVGVGLRCRSQSLHGNEFSHPGICGFSL